jgi:hypothetical protein
MNVDKGAYLFRIVNGANTRFFNLILAKNNDITSPITFSIVAVDGGYLRSAVSATHVLIAPAERVTILVDFSSLSTGDTIVVRNDAPHPYPDGSDPDPQSTALIMQFTISAAVGVSQNTLPSVLNAPLNVFPSLSQTPTLKKRVFALVELVDANTALPVALLLNGQRWAGQSSCVCALCAFTHILSFSVVFSKCDRTPHCQCNRGMESCQSDPRNTSHPHTLGAIPGTLSHPNQRRLLPPRMVSLKWISTLLLNCERSGSCPFCHW